MVFDIPRNTNDDKEAGPWWRPLAADEPRERKAWVKCPKGHLAHLMDHSIRSDGVVLPSMVCPGYGCGFHEQVRLSNWRPKGTGRHD